ncbi:MAG TPA: hypothetical protein PLH93_03960 [Flavobacteriales bacterium]|nr:hypothetical protein [Flavobacteriales bacterium]HQW86314.1 hypothetical protein [Flavobacteriales bacterium]
MSRKASDQVHRLIRSMDAAEKRYFKLYAGRHLIRGRSNHLLLFNAIAAMDVYDEEALLRRFKGRGFTARFAIAKQRLHNSILESLSAYHAHSSVDARLRRRMHEVEVLYQRALYADAERHLGGVERLAAKHEKFHVLAEVHVWQRRLLERTHYQGVTAATLDEQRQRTARLLARMTELDALWDLKSEVYLTLYGEGQARNTAQVERVRAIMARPGRPQVDALGSAQARYLHHHLEAVAGFATGDLEASHAHLLANRDLLEAERPIFIDEPYRLLAVLSNLAYVCTRTGRFKEASEHLHAYRLAPAAWQMPDTEDLEMKLFATGTSLELSIHCASGEFDHALALVPTVERGLERHGEALGTLRRAGHMFQVAMALFGGGRPAEALRWCHRLLNEAQDDQGGIVSYARMLELMLRLETEDKELLHYTLRNTERYLKGRSRTHRFEQVFLRLVRDLLKPLPILQQRAAFQRFHDDLAQLAGDPLEQPAFEHLDPLTWAESHLSGRPYGELVRERARGKSRAA